MSGKPQAPHPFVDRLNRTMRFKSWETPLAVRPEFIAIEPLTNTVHSSQVLDSYTEVSKPKISDHGRSLSSNPKDLSILEYTFLMHQFCSILDNHIARVTAKFRVQRPEIECASSFEFGCPESYNSKAFRANGNWRQGDVRLDDAVRAARYKIRPRYLETFGGSTNSIGILHEADISFWHHHANGSVQIHEHLSPGDVSAGKIGDKDELHNPTHERDARIGCRQWLDILPIAAENSKVLRYLGRTYGSYWAQLVKSDLYSEDVLTEPLLLRWAIASLDSVSYWARCTLSTFARHSSLSTKVCLLMSTLPVAYAAPVGALPPTGDLGRPETWLNFETLCHMIGWVSTCTLGAFIIYLGFRNPRRDLARDHVLSSGSAFASLVLLDSRAPPEVRWATLFVGVVFLVRLWAKVTTLYEMGHGWLVPILGFGILIDTGLVHLTVGAPGGDQGLFCQLLLASFCLSLSLCASMARFYRHIYAPNPSILPTHIHQ